MPLMTTKPMFDLAYDGGFAIGAFNVNNMEITQAIIAACASESAPLILQISKGARQYADIRYLRKIIDAAVEGASGAADRDSLRSRRHGRPDPAPASTTATRRS
jgi:fructose/tagatose bisphosphate aldolase